MRILLVGVAILATLLLIGLYQDFQNSPFRGCVREDTGTSYIGYKCGTHEVFTQ
jgi:hypothetical protein